MNNNIKALLKDLAFIFIFFMVFTTFGWQSFHIPSGSMEPTLEVGDRIFVSKFTYGYNRYSVPFDPEFIGEGKVFERTPERGDVIVFSLPYMGNVDFIKRLVGLPGDHIQMIEGKLYLNDTLVKRTFIRNVTYTDYNGIPRIAKEYEEELPSSNGGDPITHRIYHHTYEKDPTTDTTQLYIVPEGKVFMMGDNRDHSADSRYLSRMGFVRLEYIVGTAAVTTFSLFDCDQGKDIFCPAGVPLGRFFNWID